MKRFHAVLLVLLAATLIIGIFPAFAAAKTFTLWHPDMTEVPKKDGKITAFITQNTGVSWDVIPGTPAKRQGQDQYQKLQLLLASNDLPDAITLNGDRKLFSALLSAGILIDLEKYFNDAKNYPNLAKINKEVLKNSTADDGRLYTVPREFRMEPDKIKNAGGLGDGLFVDTKMLQKTKMTFSDIRTMAGFEQFLAAAKKLKTAAGLPVIPIGMGESFQGWEPLMRWFGVSEWNNVDSDNPTIWYRTPGAKQALKWANKLYKAGLMDAEAVSNKNDLFEEKLKNGRYAACFANGWAVHSATELWVNNRALGAFMMPAKFPKAPGVAKPAPVNYFDPLGKPGLVITKACKDPDAIMKWADWIMSPLGQMTIDWGLEGDKLKNDKGETVPIGWTKMADGKIDTKHETVWNTFSGQMSKIYEDWGFFWWMTVLAREKDDIETPHYPQEFKNRPVVDNFIVRAKEGTYVVEQPWRKIVPKQGGFQEKYLSFQTDIRNKYFAKLMMAKTDAQFETLWKDFIDDLETLGRAKQCEAEWIEQYKAFLKSPAGKVKLNLDPSSLAKLTQDYKNADDPLYRELKPLKYDENSMAVN